MRIKGGLLIAVCFFMGILFFSFSTGFDARMNCAYLEDSLWTINNPVDSNMTGIDSTDNKALLNNTVGGKDEENENLSGFNFDKIYRLNEEIYVCKIVDETNRDIFFTYPLNSTIHKITKRHVEKIVYADGNVDVLNERKNRGNREMNAIVEVSDLKDWEKIIHTSETEEISGMYKTGDVYARYESGTLKADESYLEKNALIILKKRAARQGANKVLIDRKKVHMAFGDLPFIELWGTGYAFQKPNDNANNKEAPE